MSFTFNFAYGANSQVIISDWLRPGIEESKHNVLTDFYARKISEISSLADCVSFGDSIG